MKIEQLVGLIVRFFAAYFFLTHVFHVGMNCVVFALQGEGGSVLAIYVAMFLAMMAVVGVLWIYPLSIARKIIPEFEGKTIQVSLTYRDLQDLCFTVLGFWLAAESLLSLLQYVLNLEFAKVRGAHVQVNIFGHAVRFIAGVWIMIGAKGIVRLLAKVRA